MSGWVMVKKDEKRGLAGDRLDRGGEKVLQISILKQCQAVASLN